MSFLSELTSFNKPLNRINTRVTNAAGEVKIEQRTENGFICNTTNNNDNKPVAPFMVIDTSSDNLLHSVLPNNPVLYIGSQDSASNKQGLLDAGITNILNVASNDIPNYYPNEFQYYTIEILDLPDSSIIQHFNTTNQYINKVLQSNGRILIHCNAGISRSSTIVIAYLIGIELFDYSTAYELVKTARKNIRPNEGFVRQLLQYEKQIKLQQQQQQLKVDSNTTTTNNTNTS